MRVLWLCNIMLPVVAEYLQLEASNKEGWLSGLASVVLQRQDENNIELALTFPASKRMNIEVPVQATNGQRLLKCYSFAGKWKDRPELYDITLEEQLREIIDDFKPDMVHCFGTEYPHTLAMCKVFPGKERILLGIQGLVSACAETYLANLPKTVINSVTLRDILRRDTLKLQQRKFEMRGEMEIEALKLTGNVTGRTAWDKSQVEKWNPKVKYYHMNETLRPIFYSDKWQKEKCESYSIFLSQGDYPLKGLHYMLMALPGIREKYPQVKVYIAGADLTKADSVKEKVKLSAYGKYLRSLIKELQLQEHVCFLGRLDASEMKERYLKSNLFVCCSSLENSPNSLGEAMMLGVPCISANVGGVSSIFTDGKDGILYDGFGEGTAEKVVKSLTGAVLKMWRDTRKMEEYSRNAAAHARETHNGEKNYQRMVEIYTDIVGGGEGQ